jgi:hypothetical protein
MTASISRRITGQEGFKEMSLGVVTLSLWWRGVAYSRVLLSGRKAEA